VTGIPEPASMFSSTQLKLVGLSDTIPCILRYMSPILVNP